MQKKNFELRGNFIQKKVTDFFIFYKPNFDYKQINDKKDQIIFIEKEADNESPENYIPCMLYRNNNSPNILICFHGNSEDIFTIDTFGLDFRSYLNMSVLFVEYPGYSIYMDRHPDSEKIYTDSLIVYEWVKRNFKVKEDQIFIFGRSLGTSPAIYLSSIKSPKALFIVSAFTSIKDIGNDIHVSPFLEGIFNSIKYIKTVKCPILLIHGEEDPLISCEQSQKLKLEVLKYDKDHIADLEKVPNMTHNDFDLKYDIINKITSFIKKYPEIFNDESNNNYNNINFNNHYQFPTSIQRIIESKTFNINEFSISNKDIRKKNALALIRLLDGRIALSHGLSITIYNDRYYKEDYTIELYKEKNIFGNINCLSQLKNENLICSTKNGDIFMFQIDEGDYEEKKKISLNQIIHNIEVLNSNEICLLSEKFVKIYDGDKLTEIKSIKLSSEYINFIKLDDCFAFVSSNKYLKFFKLEEKEMKLLSYLQLNAKINNYTMAKGYKSLIIGYDDIIENIDLEENPYQENAKISLKENISCIHRIHDELFLVSSFKGSIFQIIIKEKKQINFIKKTFVNGQIKSLLFKNIKNILFTSEDRIYVLDNSKFNAKKDDCKIS